MAIDPDGSTPATAGADRRVRRWRPRSHACSWARRRTCAGRSPGRCTTAGAEPDQHRAPGPDRRAAGARDPTVAASEVRQLVGMVQQTLDATKTFIFDVRPMVLDDLGLVPTLRRATRERSRRANIPVDFESMGQDRRLPMDLESGLFRMLDEALAAYLAAEPDRWRSGSTGPTDSWRRHASPPAPSSNPSRPPMSSSRPQAAGKRPPAGARRVGRGTARRAAGGGRGREYATSSSCCQPATWREIQSRAASIGVDGRLRRRRRPSRTCRSSSAPDTTTTAAPHEGRASRSRARRIRADPRLHGAAHDPVARRLRRDVVRRADRDRRRDRPRHRRLKRVPVHRRPSSGTIVSVSTARVRPYSGAALDWG